MVDAEGQLGGHPIKNERLLLLHASAFDPDIGADRAHHFCGEQRRVLLRAVRGGGDELRAADHRAIGLVDSLDELHEQEEGRSHVLHARREAVRGQVRYVRSLGHPSEERGYKASGERGLPLACDAKFLERAGVVLQGSRARLYRKLFGGVLTLSGCARMST